MKVSVRILLIAVAAAAIVLAATPRLKSVEPATGKAGDVLVVRGENLDSTSVTKVFLSSIDKDHEVEVKEQSTDQIRFAIPGDLKSGRYNLSVQTAGPAPTIMVQPVFCTVEE